MSPFPGWILRVLCLMIHLSELIGQTIPTIPVAMTISLLINLSSQISRILNSMHEGDGV